MGYGSVFMWKITGDFCLDLLPNLTLLMAGLPKAFTAILVPDPCFGAEWVVTAGVLLTNEATAVAKRDLLVH